jgi:hypothetical protein
MSGYGTWPWSVRSRVEKGVERAADRRDGNGNESRRVGAVSVWDSITLGVYACEFHMYSADGGGTRTYLCDHGIGCRTPPRILRCE